MATTKLKEYLCSLADAVRERAGTTCDYCAKDLPNIIKSLSAEPPYPAGVYIISATTNKENEYLGEVLVWGKAYAKQFECYSNTSAGSSPYLTTLHIGPGITEIPTEFCSGAKKLVTVYIPNGITSIKAEAFNGCSDLSTIVDADGRTNTIPEGVTEINENAFYKCTSLGLITLHDNITLIDSEAFYYSNVTINKLPENLQTIEQRAFTGCTCYFTEIPASVQSIASSAFSHNPALTTITFKGTPASIASGVFSSCGNLTTINCPWAEGAVANAPWGATNATINYNYVS